MNLTTLFEGMRAGATLLAAGAAVAVPVAAGYISNSVNQAIKEREIQAKYVELAISILRDRPTPDSAPLRRWAVSIVGDYTDRPIPSETKEVLLKYSLPLSTDPLFFPYASDFKRFKERINEVGVERALKEQKADARANVKELRDSADRLERMLDVIERTTKGE